MKKRSFVAALCMAALLVSCTGKKTGTAASPGTRAYKDTLTVVLAEDPLTLDPQSANKVIIWSVIPYFYDSLLKENQDGTVEPKLAVEWQLLDDVTWRFKLRQGVKFHNGNPFTAEDVLYSFQRAKKNPLSASTFQYFDTDNTKILDDYTIDVKLFRPYAPIFNTLTNARGFIVDKEYVEEVGDAKAAINPIGTGPYKFVSWISGSELRGTRFDDYWDDRAVTQNVVVKFITEASNRAIELETGNADIIYEIDSADADRVEAFPNAHIVSGTSFRYHTLTFSMQDPILKDKRVRYALSLGVDKPALVKAVFGNTAVAASGFMPPTVFAYKDTGVLPYDPAEAKRLLAEAGYPNGVTFKFLHEAREVDFRMAEVIQNMWKQIGVTLEDYAMESKTYAAGGNKFQVGQRAGNADEASNILIIYDSAFADKLQGNDKKLDDMLHNAMTLYDADKRAAAYAEIQDYLYDQRWSVPLAFTDALYGVSDKVQNFQFHPNQRLEVWKMSVLQ